VILIQAPSIPDDNKSEDKKSNFHNPQTPSNLLTKETTLHISKLLALILTHGFSHTAAP
jgi:hypothetical protein